MHLRMQARLPCMRGPCCARRPGGRVVADQHGRQPRLHAEFSQRGNALLELANRMSRAMAAPSMSSAVISYPDFLPGTGFSISAFVCSVFQRPRQYCISARRLSSVLAPRQEGEVRAWVSVVPCRPRASGKKFRRCLIMPSSLRARSSIASRPCLRSRTSASSAALRACSFWLVSRCACDLPVHFPDAQPAALAQPQRILDQRDQGGQREASDISCVAR